MDLAELKAQNEAEEKAKVDTTDDILDQNDDDGNNDHLDGSDSLDSDKDVDDSGSEKEKELEPWQQEDSEPVVPVAVLREKRNELKGRISERDEEIKRLKAEMEELKKGVVNINSASSTVPALKRPRSYDFDTDEEYEKALDEYERQSINHKYNEIATKQQQEQQQKQRIEKLNQAVNAHYERAQTLVSESGIDPEVYKATDSIVRQAINNIYPNQGDVVIDELIQILGDGSEKVMYYLGKNKPALNQLIVALSEDPVGIKAAAYLGETKARLITPQKRTSNARPPATKIKGDAPTNNSAKRLLKQYQEAHKKGDVQKAYNIKKDAKLNKVDVSNW